MQTQRFAVTAQQVKVSFDLLPRVPGGWKWRISLLLFLFRFFSPKVWTAQSPRPRTHAAGVRKVSDKHSAQMQKTEATVRENSVKSLLLFALHKREREKKSLYHLPFLTAV